jgi:hypothetical protein
LRGWPELANELAPMLRDEPDPRARSLLVDVLASAGTPEAQKVMCDALGSAKLRALPEHAALMQRFVFLWRPMPDTARFLVDEHARARDEGHEHARLATLSPMGSVAGRILAIDPFTSAALRRIVVDELHAATTAATKAAALGGLGNAGVGDEIEAVLALARDPDEAVRTAAASALRSSADPRARMAVLRMMSDEDAMVAREAIAVLDGYLSSDAQGSAALAAFVVTGAFNPEATGKLVAALAKRRGDDPWVSAALVALGTRSRDPLQRSHIADLLATPEGG